jgi:2-polyprenyl-3-methyl-5-hydroxy-6-metoxy-1,4-benzoquinol methylase
MKCPFCGEHGCLRVFHQSLPLFLSAVPKERARLNRVYDMTIAFCPHCGLGFNCSQLSESVLESVYDDYIYIDPFEKIGHSQFAHITDIIRNYSDYNSKIVEIGSSVGYLLAALKDSGYKNLLGIDPSPQSDIALSKGLNIRKEYYGGDFDEDVDMFVLRHVFEHFKDPFEIFRNMVSHIGQKGCIVIETPDFGGFHHQHLYFYSLPFYKNLAERYGIKLIDYKLYSGNIIAVFSNSGAPALPDDIGETLDELAHRAALKQEMLEDNTGKLRGFIKKHKEIYWWGTGSFSIILLSRLQQSELADKIIIPLDTDIKRSGYMLANISEPVRFSKDIKGSRPEAMVLASSFVNEVRDMMKELDIIPDDILVFF